MATYDLVIQNGRVVTPGGVTYCHIGIAEGEIAALSTDPLEGEEEIDAAKNYVVPGVIDSHVHLEMPVDGIESADDFYTGTLAGAFGGVTTVLDFAMQEPGRGEMECIAERRACADAGAVIDYSLHANFTDRSSASLQEIKKIIASGIPSFKLLTTYEERGLMVDDGFLYAVLREVRDRGGMVLLHAENGYLNRYLAQKLLAEGKTAWIYHYQSRPNFVEAAAVANAIEIAKALSAPLYIVHLSTEEGLEAVKRAKLAGYPVYAETCPHYLEFTKDRYLDDDGLDYIMSPPLRTAADREALWQGIAAGWIDVVASEHCPFTRAQKRLGDSFATVPSGVMGIETLLPYLLSEGVNKGRFSIIRLVEVLCENPARIFGLQDKGAIAVGKDADLVIVDPDLERPVRAGELHMNTDYNIYEGQRLRGWPILTIARGEVIVKEGKFLGERGRGHFIERWLRRVSGLTLGGEGGYNLDGSGEEAEGGERWRKSGDNRKGQ